jgi:hypothetical protein
LSEKYNYEKHKVLGVLGSQGEMNDSFPPCPSSPKCSHLVRGLTYSQQSWLKDCPASSGKCTSFLSYEITRVPQILQETSQKQQKKLTTVRRYTKSKKPKPGYPKFFRKPAKNSKRN